MNLRLPQVCNKELYDNKSASYINIKNSTSLIEENIVFRSIILGRNTNLQNINYVQNILIQNSIFRDFIVFDGSRFIVASNFKSFLFLENQFIDLITVD